MGTVLSLVIALALHALAVAVCRGPIGVAAVGWALPVAAVSAIVGYGVTWIWPEWRRPIWLTGWRCALIGLYAGLVPQVMLALG